MFCVSHKDILEENMLSAYDDSRVTELPGFEKTFKTIEPNN